MRITERDVLKALLEEKITIQEAKEVMTEGGNVDFSAATLML